MELKLFIYYLWTQWGFILTSDKKTNKQLLFINILEIVICKRNALFWPKNNKIIHLVNDLLL